VDRQDVNRVFEIIVIDSGSTDQTAAIAGKHPRVRLVEIAPGDFGHGKTRNLGASMARGDYLVFLNADAIPVDNQWLNALLAPFDNDNNTVGVFSRHLPQPGCFLYMVRDISGSMPGIPGPVKRNRVDSLDFMIFSTVSCAIRRSCWRDFPFDGNIVIAEDQEWAARVLGQGFNIVYQPASMVVHSHNYSPRQLFQVKRDVARSTGKFSSKTAAVLLGFVLTLGGMVFKVMGDLAFILFSYRPPGGRKIPFSTKLREIKTSIRARAAGFWGKYRGWLEIDHD
jgi:rhamnosyltransferase